MNSWQNDLSLAYAAKKVVSGFKVMEAIRNQSAKLVLVASDASANTRKQYFNKSKFYGIECIEVEDSSVLSKAINKSQRMYLAILDQNFADMIKNKMKEE